MCEKCVTIDAAIARYQRLKKQITDLQMTEGANRLIAKLETDKLELHPKE
jgi:hypothetical protein